MSLIELDSSDDDIELLDETPSVGNGTPVPSVRPSKELSKNLPLCDRASKSSKENLNIVKGASPRGKRRLSSHGSSKPSPKKKCRTPAVEVEMIDISTENNPPSSSALLSSTTNLQIRKVSSIRRPCNGDPRPTKSANIDITKKRKRSIGSRVQAPSIQISKVCSLSPVSKLRKSESVKISKGSVPLNAIKLKKNQLHKAKVTLAEPKKPTPTDIHSMLRPGIELSKVWKEGDRQFLKKVSNPTTASTKPSVQAIETIDIDEDDSNEPINLQISSVFSVEKGGGLNKAWVEEVTPKNKNDSDDDIQEIEPSSSENTPKKSSNVAKKSTGGCKYTRKRKTLSPKSKSAEKVRSKAGSKFKKFATSGEKCEKRTSFSVTEKSSRVSGQDEISSTADVNKKVDGETSSAAEADEDVLIAADVNEERKDSVDDEASRNVANESSFDDSEVIELIDSDQEECVTSTSENGVQKDSTEIEVIEGVSSPQFELVISEVVGNVDQSSDDGLGLVIADVVGSEDTSNKTREDVETVDILDDDEPPAENSEGTVENRTKSSHKEQNDEVQVDILDDEEPSSEKSEGTVEKKAKSSHKEHNDEVQVDILDDEEPSSKKSEATVEKRTKSRHKEQNDEVQIGILDDEEPSSEKSEGTVEKRTKSRQKKHNDEEPSSEKSEGTVEKRTKSSQKEHNDDVQASNKKSEQDLKRDDGSLRCDARNGANSEVEVMETEDNESEKTDCEKQTKDLELVLEVNMQSLPTKSDERTLMQSEEKENENVPQEATSPESSEVFESSEDAKEEVSSKAESFEGTASSEETKKGEPSSKASYSDSSDEDEEPESSIQEKTEILKGNTKTGSSDDSKSSEEPKPTSSSKDESDTEESYDPKTLKRIKFLEQLCKKCEKKIRKYELQENSLDDLDDENSGYVMVDRYKKRYIEVWRKLCELKGGDPELCKTTKRIKVFEGSSYPEINASILKRLNIRQDYFPDYTDVLEVVQNVNKKKNLRMNENTIQVEARATFQAVVKTLKRKREKTFLHLFGTKETDEEDWNCDPSKNNSDLSEKLKENEGNADVEIQKIINKYVAEQEALPKPEEDDDKSDTEEESQSEDEDQESTAMEDLDDPESSYSPPSAS